MIESIAIALWSHLFCGPWSESGKIFGWLKSWASEHLPEWAQKPLIGCSMCHAVWVSGLFQLARLCKGWSFDAGNALMILSASFMAWVLDDFAELRDKWKNA